MSDEPKNQFALMSTALLGGLLLSTAAFALNAFLVAYLLIRYTSAWRTYRSYAITSAVLIFAVWLTLLVATAVLLPLENKAKTYGQFGAMVSVVVITVTGFLAAAAVSAIGLTQSQRTLTSDLRIVRSFFGVILGLTGLAFLWVLIAGSMVLKRARLSFYAEGLEQEAARKEASGVSEEVKRLRQETANAKARADKAVEDAKIAKYNAVLAAKKRATTEAELNRLQETRKAARDAETAANNSIAEAQAAVERENAATAQLVQVSSLPLPNPIPPRVIPDPTGENGPPPPPTNSMTRGVYRSTRGLPMASRRY